MGTNVSTSRHPLVHHKLALLRSADTGPTAFRCLVRELAQLIFFEASQDLALTPALVRTPLGDCPAQRLGDRLALVPILRAGLGMAEAILDFIPDASVWHLGLYRDHQTLQPVTYYNKLPPRADVNLAFVVDPMLATGGSAVAAIDILKRWGARPYQVPRPDRGAGGGALSASGPPGGGDPSGRH